MNGGYYGDGGKRWIISNNSLRPLSRRLGVLTKDSIGDMLVVEMFPYPPEVNGDFYYTDKDMSKLTGISFPYPYEGNRGSYAEKLYSIAVSRFGFRTLSR